MRKKIAVISVFLLVLFFLSEVKAIKQTNSYNIKVEKEKLQKLQTACSNITEDIVYCNVSLFDYNPIQFNEMAREMNNSSYQNLSWYEKYEIDKKYSLMGNATLLEDENHMNGGWQNGFFRFDMDLNSPIPNQRIATHNIVENKLQNNQLILKNKNQNDITYFPTIEQAEKRNLVGDGKPYQEILRDWQMSFVKEKSGYIYFNSDEHHVKRDYNSKTLKLHGGTAGGKSEWDIHTTGLFPFNTDCYTEETTKEKNNLFYGIRIDFDFYMTKTGQTINLNTGKMEDIIYEFTGDDDVWVFIDDSLILDIGGGKAVLFNSYINFAKNESYIEMVNDPIENTIKKDVYTNNIFGEEGLKEGKHTLTMFYMERFGGSSNLKVRFNLPEVTSYEGIKEWRDDKNALNLRPEMYTLQLYGNGEYLKEQSFKTENWSFKDLQKYDEIGNEIKYTVKENEIILQNGDYYTPTIQENRIINTLTGNIEKQIQKVWLDDENLYNTRPNEIAIVVKERI